MLFVPVTQLHQVQKVVQPGKWAKLRSACELARSWMAAGGFPPAVRAVLETNATWRGAEVVRGFFEHGDMLDGPRGPSRTDLMVVARTTAGLAAVAVEGKVDEPFDNKTVRQWAEGGSDGKARRLEVLAETLAIEPARVADVRYQLVHRCAAAVREARRFGATEALTLVQAYTIDNSRCVPAKADECAEDYRRFAEAIGLHAGSRNSVAGPRQCGPTRLWLAWVDCAPLPYDGAA
jgi:hypothetical protein